MKYLQYVNKQFPRGVYPLMIRGVGDHLHEVQGTPIEMLYHCALAIVAGIVGDRYKVNGAFSDYTQFLNQYFVGVGNSSSGKSTAVNPFINPILEEEKTEMRAYLKNKKQGMEVKDPRFIVRDATQEGIIKRMASTNAPLFSLSTEARANFNTINGAYKKSGNEYSFYNMAWDATPYSVDRSGSEPIYIERAFLSSLWLMQPDAFKSFTRTEEQLSNGFIQRILLFKSDIQFKKAELNTPPIDANIMYKWNSFILTLYNQRVDNTVKIIRATNDARIIFTEYFNSFEEIANTDGEIFGYISKSTEKACRLAGLFALCDGKIEIDAETAKNACGVIDYSNAIALKEEAIELFQRERTNCLAVSVFNRTKRILPTEIEAIAKFYPETFDIRDGRSKGSRLLSLKEN